MTDWFRQNPFIAALIGVCSLALLIGGFLAFNEAARLSEERMAFDSKTGELQRLQRNKPFPNQANVSAASEETDKARELLAQIGKQFAVDVPPATPQAFQDELAKLVKDLGAKAGAKQVQLPENFYLGFEQYETQLPSTEAAPYLARQLRAIHAVAAVLVEAGIKSLGPIVRPPIRSEQQQEPQEEENNPRTKKGDDEKEPQAAGLEIAPFEIAFNSDQSSFRLAFNRILELEPPVFVRLLAVENSSPAAPPKNADPSAEAQNEEAQPASGIRPVVGRETLNVNLRLAAAVSSDSPLP